MLRQPADPNSLRAWSHEDEVRISWRSGGFGRSPERVSGHFRALGKRSRAYRWSEDKVGRDRDRHQLLCFAIALWNGKDPILKDSTPTHSYMKYLYKYPQAAVLYAGLIDGNRPLLCCW